MRVSDLAKMPELTLINAIYDKEIEGVFISDMVSDIIAGASPNNLLITVQTHKNLIATANLVDISAIIFVRDKQPQPEVVELANRAGITLFSTKLDAWKLAIKLHDMGVA